MPVPLRLVAYSIPSDELEAIRRTVEGAGGLIAVRCVDRPEELFEISWTESDVILAEHDPDRVDARFWLPSLLNGVAPPVILLCDEGDSGRCDWARSMGVFAVVPRGQPDGLLKAITLVVGPSFLASGSGEEAGHSVPSARRRMAGLMGVIGHDLRGILGGISGAVEVLSFQCPPGALGQRRTIGLLERQCRLMAGLLDDYAEVVRLESRRKRPLEIVELGATLARSIDRTLPDVGGGSIDLRRVDRPDSLWIQVDAGLLELLVRHVLLYCARGSPGRGLVRVDWRCSVDRFELIFERRSGSPESETFRSGRESELDLFLASTLVEQMGGALRPGTPFVVELPYLTARRPEEPSDGDPLPWGPHQADRDQYVLMIDSSTVSGRALGLLIGRLGWRVRVTSDIDEALQMVRSIRPVVVLIDLQMPVIDAFCLARLIRCEAPVDRAKPLLIGINGLDDLPPIDGLEDPSFDHILTKPVMKDQISALLPSHFQSG